LDLHYKPFVELLPQLTSPSVTLVYQTNMGVLREDIEFKACDGTTLRGWLYPQARKSPCIIMSHGVGYHPFFPLLLSFSFLFLFFSFLSLGGGCEDLQKVNYTKRKTLE
jgi:hypothetical protein